MEIKKAIFTRFVMRKGIFAAGALLAVALISWYIILSVVIIGSFAPCLWDGDNGIANCSSEVVRNFGWLGWMLASIVVATSGIYLAWRGREIQQNQWETQNQSYLRERFEKASDMLYNSNMQARINGCGFLKNLAIENSSMAPECLSMLFNVIRHPYLSDKEKKDYEACNDKDEYFLKRFPIDTPLRDDITEAIKSFTGIFYDYNDAILYIDNFPRYFWLNDKKPSIYELKENLGCANFEGANLKEVNLDDAHLFKAFLMNANLEGASLRRGKLSYAHLNEANFKNANLTGANLDSADLEDTNLEDANLEDTNLEDANLKGANLKNTNLKHANLNRANLEGTNLENADVTGADMREAKNLTKEQILSAKWGCIITIILGTGEKPFESIEGEPPGLPEELMQDEEIQEWLSQPRYTEDDEDFYS